MTLTAEERAKAVVEECRGYDIDGDDLFIACDRAERLIAQAIRQAQNDKLEEAAAAYEAKGPGGWSTEFPDETAAFIRSLITKD